MKSILKAAGIGILAFGFASCEKDNSENLEVFDDAVSSELEQREFEIEDEAGVQECNSIDFSNHFADGVIVTDTMSSYPKTITIDYGEGITDEKGRVKSGMIIITLTGEMKSTGSERSFTFVDFRINKSSIEGTRIVTNLGENEDGNVEFSIIGEITRTKDGKERVKSFNRKREWLEGFETCDRDDDVILISGTSTVQSGSRVGTRTITTPIRIERGVCDYPTEGIVKVERQNGRGGVIDFGNGDCDSEATLTLNNGNVKSIDLENRRCRR